MYEVFKTANKEKHVAPCNPDGTVALPHVLNFTCVCDPKYTFDCDSETWYWFHEEIN